MKIPKRDKSIIATAKSNSLTLDQGLLYSGKRYKQAMKELSQI